MHDRATVILRGSEDNSRESVLSSHAGFGTDLSLSALTAPGHSNINKLRRNIYVFYFAISCPWYPLIKCQNQAQGVPWRWSGGLAHTGLGVRGTRERRGWATCSPRQCCPVSKVGSTPEGPLPTGMVVLLVWESASPGSLGVSRTHQTTQF